MSAASGSKHSAAKLGVSIFALGGTIASAPIASSHGGARPRLGIAKLVSSLPAELRDRVRRSTDVTTRPSSELRIGDVVGLAAAVAKELTRRDVCGVVITQGTDTLEEVAFSMTLLSSSPKPIVLTGAMRHAGLPGADGPGNLAAAVCVATSPQAIGLGPLVVMGDCVYWPPLMRKAHTSRPDAFEVRAGGQLGWVNEGQFTSVFRPALRSRATARLPTSTARVVVVPVGLGDDGDYLDAVFAQGVDGLVIQALGGGHVPERWVSRLARMGQDIPIVLASRTGSGEVLTGTYHFPGSEVDLLGRGLISAGFLDAPKARILLLFLLMSGASRTTIRRRFALYGKS